ncbi:Ig-like domain-containing protein [Bacterioplanoides sp.]|uniref:Ig-like domain-containing protein n=1 Tax=Bacterioplanoides sp. TaxID=2066072 RepID=UPI003B5A20DE
MLRASGLFASVLLTATMYSQSAAADLCGNNTASGSGYKLAWSTATLGTGLGASGFSVFDADQDGKSELLFGSGNGFGQNASFVVVKFDTETSAYTPVCQSAPGNIKIKKIISFSSNSISQGSAVLYGDGRIEIIDHQLGSLVQKITTGISDVNDMLLADVDNDGIDELAVLTNDDISLYRADSYVTDGSINYGSKRFASGSFTASDKTQLALNNGAVIEYEGGSATLKWDYRSTGFSNNLVAAGDLDGDGLDEIVAADSWYKLRAFNADSKGLLWEHTADLDIDALTVADHDGDDVPNVIYGDGQWGKVHILKNSDGSFLSSVSNPDHGVTGIAVAQLDVDSGLELVWGAGYSSTGADYLYIHDIESDTREWKSGESEGPYYGVAMADVNNDGITDQLYASRKSASGSNDGIVFAINGKDGGKLWQTTGNTFSRNAWTGLHDLAAADTDGDGVVEVFVATDRLYDGRIYVLNGMDGSIKQTIEFQDGAPIYSLEIADIDNDQELEIIAGGGKEHTGSPGNYVYIVDGNDFSWASPFQSLNNGWQDIWTVESIDFDGDGSREIVALNDKFYVLDPDNNGLVKSDLTLSAVAQTVDVHTGDEVVYGTAAGTLYRLNADASYNKIAEICDGNVVALEAITPIVMAFSCGGRLATYDVVGDNVEWHSSTAIDPSLGVNDRLVYASVNGKRSLLLGGLRPHLFVEGNAGSSAEITAQDASFNGHFRSDVSGTLTADYSGTASLSYAIYQQPTSGSVEITNKATGEFTFTPNRNYVGATAFKFVVSDGSVASNIATVTITLENSQPAGKTETFNNHWKRLMLAQLSGSDADNDPVSFEITRQPANGTLTLLDELTGEFSYISQSALATQMSFDYRVFDGAEYSPTHTVTVILTNDKPQAVVNEFETYYSVNIASRLTAEDTNGDSLTFELVEQPALGTATLTPDGLFSYQVSGTEAYSTVVSYRVFDGREWSDAGSINIRVIGQTSGGNNGSVNPVVIDAISADRYSAVGNGQVNFSLAVSGGSGNYQYRWEFGDGSVSNDKSPSHTYSTAGMYDIKVVITDSDNGANVAQGYLKFHLLPAIESPQVQLQVSVIDAVQRAINLTVEIANAEGNYQVIANMGDGSRFEVQANNGQAVIPHKYQQDGAYNITVEVHSANGSSLSALTLANSVVSFDKGKVEGADNSGGSWSALWAAMLFLMMFAARQRRYG